MPGGCSIRGMRYLTLAAVLLAAPVLAQEVVLADAGGSFTNPTAAPVSPVASFFVALREPLIDILAAIGSALLGLLALWVRNKAKDNKLFSALQIGTDIVATYVAKAEVELKPMFKSFLADGKISAEEGAQLKAKVLEILKRDMPASLMQTLGSALGPALDGWLSGKIEQAVAVQGAPESP